MFKYTVLWQIAAAEMRTTSHKK